MGAITRMSSVIPAVRDAAHVSEQRPLNLTSQSEKDLATLARAEQIKADKQRKAAAVKQARARLAPVDEE